MKQGSKSESDDKAETNLERRVMARDELFDKKGC